MHHRATSLLVVCIVVINACCAFVISPSDRLISTVRSVPSFSHREILRSIKHTPTACSRISATAAMSTTAQSISQSRTQVKVASYNVLSSHLSSPSYFTACKAEYCDPRYRLDLVKKELEREMASNAVVCLQEVSRQWTGALHPLFAKNGYHFITALYGNRFNGFMGVGLAVPTQKYDLLEVDITRIADVKYTPRKKNDESFLVKLLSSFKKWFWDLLTRVRLYTPPENYWESALYRSNQMICARLQCKETGKTFVVGNYHMPCAFRLPPLMSIHCSLSAQHIQRFARGDPYVFAGDFNIKPNSPQYKLLTEGKLDKSHPDYPHPPAEDNWLPEAAPMRSAYFANLGAEPDFTNNAQIKDDEPFIDTLDYLFLSDQWNVEGVRELWHRDQADGPLPNKEQPSDHILIHATLSLPEEEGKSAKEVVTPAE